MGPLCPKNSCDYLIIVTREVCDVQINIVQRLITSLRNFAPTITTLSWKLALMSFASLHRTPLNYLLLIPVSLGAIRYPRTLMKTRLQGLTTFSSFLFLFFFWFFKSESWSLKRKRRKKPSLHLFVIRKSSDETLQRMFYDKVWHLRDGLCLLKQNCQFLFLWISRASKFLSSKFPNGRCDELHVLTEFKPRGLLSRFFNLLLSVRSPTRLSGEIVTGLESSAADLL